MKSHKYEVKSMKIISVKKIKLILTTMGALIMLFNFISCDSWGWDYPEPEVKNAEFSFTLIYEIDGEEKIIKDTLICEYDGIGWNEGILKYRKWKSKFGSGISKIILWVGNDVESLEGFSTRIMKIQEVFFYPGPAQYYMGDGEKEPHFPGIAYFEQEPGLSGNDGTEGYLADEKIFERFGIRVISWECDPPIQNSFK